LNDPKSLKLQAINDSMVPIARFLLEKTGIPAWAIRFMSADFRISMVRDHPQ